VGSGANVIFMTSVRLFFMLGSALAGLAVGIGAFGAHRLGATLSSGDLAIFETGVRYQMYHALGLLAVAWAASRWESSAVVIAGWMFVAGIVLFSGSLYLLVITGPRWLGAITPLGGVAFLIGWALLAWTAFRG
jgi:uncharacterized membrane protein YgdD (TMEM256/DUF423 family)